MASRIANLLTRTHDGPRQTSARWEEKKTDRQIGQWSPAAKGLAIFGVAAAVAVVAAGVYYGPDLIRYLKIRRM